MPKWVDSMSVGIPEVDEDHRRLVEIIAHFRRNNSTNRGLFTAQELLTYTISHFSNEEAHWVRIGYQNARMHKKAHERIVVKLMSIIRQMKTETVGCSESLNAEVQSLCTHFLNEHLLRLDMEMKPRPVAEETDLEQPRPSPAEISEYDVLRVLVVEDEKFSRSLIRKMLTNIGIKKVIEAEEGGVALAMVKKFSPNLILCDLEMAPVDGISFVRNLREYENITGLAQTAVVFITSNTDSSNVQKALKLQASGYLAKPVHALNLKQKIDVVLRSGLIANPTPESNQ